MNLNSRLEKVEQRAREIGESTSNLVEMIIPWPDEDGGPIHCMVTPDFMQKVEKIYGNRQHGLAHNLPIKSSCP
jgi:hypothetical protein